MACLYNPGIVQANFKIPASACLGQSFSVKNTSVWGSTYYWNFCSGNLPSNPIASNLGNLGVLVRNIEGILIKKVNATGKWYRPIVGFSNNFLVTVNSRPSFIGSTTECGSNGKTYQGISQIQLNRNYPWQYAKIQLLTLILIVHSLICLSLKVSPPIMTESTIFSRYPELEPIQRRSWPYITVMDKPFILLKATKTIGTGVLFHPIILKIKWFPLVFTIMC